MEHEETEYRIICTRALKRDAFSGADFDVVCGHTKQPVRSADCSRTDWVL